jgi:hypothetical protein
MDYRESIQQLRGTVYYNRRLIRVNQDIEVLRHQMTGLARSGPVLSPQQAKSPLPLPHYQHDPNASPVALIEAVEAKEKEARMLAGLIQECGWIESMDQQDKEALIELTLLHEPMVSVAEKYGYSRPGMYKHLEAVLRDI